MYCIIHAIITLQWSYHDLTLDGLGVTIESDSSRGPGIKSKSMYAMAVCCCDPC